MHHNERQAIAKARQPQNGSQPCQPHNERQPIAARPLIKSMAKARQPQNESSQRDF